MRMVILGLPPTTNNLYAVVRGRQVKVEAGRAWTRLAAAVAAATWGERPVSAAPFAVLITYHLGAYERDVDGSHKAIIDGFAPREPETGQRPIVWHDDRQLVLLAARKVRAPKGVLPYVSIIVRELAGATGESPGYLEPTPARGALSFETTVLPPSTNNAYTTFGGTRRKSAASREAYATYQKGFAALVADDPDLARFPLTGALRVRVRYGYVANRRDVDGSHKLLLDAARGQGLVWRDDLQITSLSLAKGRVPAGLAPRIAGDVRALGAAAQGAR